MRAAVGFSVHTGWAALVVLAEPLALLERRRLELADPAHDSRFVFHAAAERGEPARRIREASLAARERAAEALRGLLALHPISLAALHRPKRALPALEAILASHPLLHAAEGELFRGAIEEACRAAGLAVVRPAPEVPALGQPGPPWGKDQRAAAALAWGALQRRG